MDEGLLHWEGPVSRSAVPCSPRAAHCTHQGLSVTHTELTEGDLCPSALTWLWVCTQKMRRPWCCKNLNYPDLFDQNAQIGVGSMTKCQWENQMQSSQEWSLALGGNMFKATQLLIMAGTFTILVCSVLQLRKTDVIAGNDSHPLVCNVYGVQCRPL